MKNEASLKEIGNNIQIARLKKKLTQEALAEKCNVSAKYISAMERGISSGSISLIIDICNILTIFLTVQLIVLMIVLMYSLLKHLQFI